ncbi:hypothetical protein CRENBAI_005693 [Crenichthys baileyi]|uniref:Uncharacterized protein n=1 Tax=Crenichthys baileyi TaxID=28760 RepID=A0AAV9S8C7_9TELE
MGNGGSQIKPADASVSSPHNGSEALRFASGSLGHLHLLTPPTSLPRTLLVAHVRSGSSRVIYTCSNSCCDRVSRWVRFPTGATSSPQSSCHWDNRVGASSPSTEGPPTMDSSRLVSPGLGDGRSAPSAVLQPPVQPPAPSWIQAGLEENKRKSMKKRCCGFVLHLMDHLDDLDLVHSLLQAEFLAVGWLNAPAPVSAGGPFDPLPVAVKAAKLQEPQHAAKPLDSQHAAKPQLRGPRTDRLRSKFQSFERGSRTDRLRSKFQSQLRGPRTDHLRFKFQSFERGSRTNRLRSKSQSFEGGSRTNRLRSKSQSFEGGSRTNRLRSKFQSFERGSRTNHL